MKHNPLPGKNISLILHSVTKSKGFKMASLKIKSLLKHVDEIRFVLADLPLDVLSLLHRRLYNLRIGIFIFLGFPVLLIGRGQTLVSHRNPKER